MAQAIPIHLYQFPRSYAFLQSALPGVSAQPSIWTPFLAYSNLAEADALAATRWGTTPWIFASPLAPSQWAMFASANPARVDVSIDVLTRFESASSDTTAQRFLLAKVLHELCHWGCFRGQVDEGAIEVGEAFERSAFGDYLYPWYQRPDPATSVDPRVFTDPATRATTCRQLLAGTRHVPGRLADPAHAVFSGDDASQPLPRGTRNNNPGNLRKGTDAWLGLAQSFQMADFQQQENDFLVFREPEWGLRAMASLLRTYKRKHGLSTPRAIVGRWAPASDNNDVASYAQAVAGTLGIGVDDVADADDDDTLVQLMQAMVRHENGARIQYPELQYRAALALL